jgi:hypothetical protein
MKDLLERAAKKQYDNKAIEQISFHSAAHLCVGYIDKLNMSLLQ